MPQHSPAPTPHRAVYGFAFYLFFQTLFVFYVLWAYLPTEQLGLTYLPDKYFAVYLPILVLVAMFFFEFFIYPGINMSMTPEVDDLSSVLDVSLVQRYNTTSSAQFAWQQLKSSTIYQSPKAKCLGNPKQPSASVCELCQTTHQATTLKPIASLRFMDLAEMNKAMFGFEELRQ